MTWRQRENLQAACDMTLTSLQSGVAPAAIIAELVEKHGASARFGTVTNTLRCAGVSASCTWSRDKGLLDRWRKNAVIRLMSEREVADA